MSPPQCPGTKAGGATTHVARSLLARCPSPIAPTVQFRTPGKLACMKRWWMPAYSKGAFASLLWASGRAFFGWNLGNQRPQPALFVSVIWLGVQVSVAAASAAGGSLYGRRHLRAVQSAQPSLSAARRAARWHAHHKPRTADHDRPDRRRSVRHLWAGAHVGPARASWAQGTPAPLRGCPTRATPYYPGRSLRPLICRRRVPATAQARGSRSCEGN